LVETVGSFFWVLFSICNGTLERESNLYDIAVFTRKIYIIVILTTYKEHTGLWFLRAWDVNTKTTKAFFQSLSKNLKKH